MNKAQEILSKLKLMFQADDSKIEHKLADGTVLKMDKMEKGGSLLANGSIPAILEYTLADGTKITCDAAGLITEVTPVAATFTDYKLVDGTNISVDKLDIGGAVTINGQAAPAGDYTLEDTKVITVDASGMITAISPAPVDASATVPQLMAAMEVKFTELFNRLSEENKLFRQELEAHKQEMAKVTGKTTDQSAMLKEVFALVSEIVGAPVSDPPEQRKKFSFANTDGRKKTFGRFQEAAAKLNEQWKENNKVTT